MKKDQNEDFLNFSDIDDLDGKSKRVRKSSRGNIVFGWILLVFIIVAVTLTYVLSVAKEKPDSPQALVAAAFNQPITSPQLKWKPGMGPKPLIYHPAANVQPVFFNQPITNPQLKWKPGMGPEPLIYHPAAAPAPVWQTMYICPTHGTNGKIVYSKNGRPYCSICKQLMTVKK